MKKWILTVVLLGAGVGSYFLWKEWRQQTQANAVPARQTTAKAELRDISFAVNAAGEITPAEQVSVRPEINGRIELLPVDIGDAVKKGDFGWRR